MTDQPDQHPTMAPTTTAPTTATATPKPSRWERLRPRSRLSRIAVAVAATATTFFVAAAIFATGFTLSSGCGEHHGQWNGSGHTGEGQHS
jgi:hypothetical protein